MNGIETLLSLFQKEFAQRTFFGVFLFLAILWSHNSLKKEIDSVNGKLDNHITETIKKTDRLDNRIDRPLEHLIKPGGK